MIDFVIILFLIYCLTFCFTLIFKRYQCFKHFNFPPMTKTRSGIAFNSFKRHKILLQGFKTYEYMSKVYLKDNDKMIEIDNVENVFLLDDYLYFKGKGKVKIKFDCTKIYKYFNVKITSSRFEIDNYKQQAILDIINNKFNFVNCQKLKRYMQIIEKCLNINLTNKQIIIKQNQFSLPFTIKYKVNNKIVKVNVNQTLEEK